MSATTSEDSAQGRYWCHQCRAEIRPGSDFLCPLCHNDFIEVMEDVIESPDDDPTLFVAFDGAPPAATPAETAAQQQQQQQQPENNPPQQAQPLFTPFPFQTMFGNVPIGGAPNGHAAAPAPQMDLGHLFQQVDTMLQQMSTMPTGATHTPQPPVMQVFTAGGGTAPMNFQTYVYLLCFYSLKD